ncbi:hypothetical protein ES706_03745 [subsurface metagenome]
MRSDPQYLRQILELCVGLGPAARADPTSEHATMLADLRDYLMFLTLDAMEDEAEARRLAVSFAELGVWLAGRGERFYEGLLFSLEQLLCVRHGIAMLPNELIDRGSFEASWRRTKERLGL